MTSLQHRLHLKGLVCKEDGPETRIPETAMLENQQENPSILCLGPAGGGTSMREMLKRGEDVRPSLPCSPVFSLEFGGRVQALGISDIVEPP